VAADAATTATIGATKEFWGGFTAWGNQTFNSLKNVIQLLKEKPGLPAQQIMNGVVRLVDSGVRNPQGVLKAVKGAVDDTMQQLSTNPARFLGKNLPNVLMNMVPVGGAANEAENVLKATEALEDVAATTQVAKTFEQEAAMIEKTLAGTPAQPPALASEIRKYEAYPSGADAWHATWGNGDKAYVNFQRDGAGIDLTGINRGNQPKYSGGQMLAETLNKVGIGQPTSIKFSAISNQQTINQIEAGIAPNDTLLGSTMQNAVSALGGTATQWTTGMSRGKLWMQVSIEY
jgi:hypothetical protein